MESMSNSSVLIASYEAVRGMGGLSSHDREMAAVQPQDQQHPLSMRLVALRRVLTFLGFQQHHHDADISSEAWERLVCSYEFLDSSSSSQGSAESLGGEMESMASMYAIFSHPAQQRNALCKLLAAVYGQTLRAVLSKFEFIRLYENVSC